MQIRAPNASGVALIPWDPESPEHIQRLIDQRIDCGWHAEMPAGPWRKLQAQGTKCIYWLVSMGVCHCLRSDTPLTVIQVLPHYEPGAQEKLQAFISARPEVRWRPFKLVSLD